MATVREGAEQVSNALTIYTDVQTYRDSFAAVLPSHLQGTADTYVRLATSLLRSNTYLAKVAQQNPQSALRALLKGASLGLTPGETFDLIPFGGRNPAVVGAVRYTGLIELMFRAGAVNAVKAEIIYEKDSFNYQPGMARPLHVVDWFADRGPMIGAYAYADMKGGGTSQVVVMNRAQIERIRDGSPSWRYEDKRKDSPWTTWPDRMWLKTVIHQLRKWVPISTEYITAQVEAAERGRARAAADGLDKDVSPLENEDPDLAANPAVQDAEVESETDWSPDPDVGANDDT